MHPNHFYILVALASADRHGLDIMRDVQRQTNGALRLWPATLYGSLDRLVDNGWIEPLAESPDGESERKRYYSITTRGRTVLAAEAKRLEAMARAARASLATS
jgi:DNA-binding PadR family transcriptional regulator